MKAKKATFKQKGRLKKNCEIIAQFDEATRNKFLGYLQINHSVLTSNECNRLIKETDEVIAFGKRDIDMKVSIIERELIEGLRMIKLTDFAEILKCVNTLIDKESR